MVFSCMKIKLFIILSIVIFPLGMETAIAKCYVAIALETQSKVENTVNIVPSLGVAVLSYLKVIGRGAIAQRGRCFSRYRYGYQHSFQS